MDSFEAELLPALGRATAIYPFDGEHLLALAWRFQVVFSIIFLKLTTKLLCKSQLSAIGSVLNITVMYYWLCHVLSPVDSRADIRLFFLLCIVNCTSMAVRPFQWVNIVDKVNSFVFWSHVGLGSCNAFVHGISVKLK